MPPTSDEQGSGTLLKRLTGLPRLLLSGIAMRSSNPSYQKRSSPVPPEPLARPILLESAYVPPGVCVFAFGDVHGHYDLLSAMMRKIRSEATSRSGPIHVVGLGDFIDRGPESAKVLDLLVELSRETTLKFTALKGNHEDLLLKFLEAPSEIGPLWMDLGGEETLHSFGLGGSLGSAHADFRRIRDEFAGRLKPAHLGLLLSLRTHLTIGDYFFCHAGVRPGTPLGQQSDRDLMWIRSGFAENSELFEKIIVHGHSPVVAPELRPNRINIDTGAYLTGNLSCAVLESNRVSTIEVHHNSGVEPDVKSCD